MEMMSKAIEDAAAFEDFRRKIEQKIEGALRVPVTWARRPGKATAMAQAREALDDARNAEVELRAILADEEQPRRHAFTEALGRTTATVKLPGENRAQYRARVFGGKS